MINNSYKKNKVLITSYFYPPEQTPRAFRTHELVKEFSKRGYMVDVCVPDIACANEEKLKNCRYYYVESMKKGKLATVAETKGSNIKRYSKVLNYFKKALRYIVGGDPRAVRYYDKLYRILMKNCNENYDLIISIGLPFYVHLATARFIINTNQEGVKICDYGDPFYFNPSSKKLYFLKFLEKWAVNQFDFISIPTGKSLNYYKFLKDKNSIKIIPQGFNYSNIRLAKYERNHTLKFCYAGIFYKAIRNPEYLFEFLASIEMDFQFVIYTRVNDTFFQEVYKKYKDKLGDKLLINDFISREELIMEMSKMDFLVNIENENSNQVPSKLIDYALSGRPILSMSQKTFSEKIFIDFINGKYDDALTVNTEDYDIENIVDEFELLL